MDTPELHRLVTPTLHIKGLNSVLTGFAVVVDVRGWQLKSCSQECKVATTGNKVCVKVKNVIRFIILSLQFRVESYHILSYVCINIDFIAFFENDHHKKEHFS